MPRGLFRSWELRSGAHLYPSVIFIPLFPYPPQMSVSFIPLDIPLRSPSASLLFPHQITVPFIPLSAPDSRPFHSPVCLSHSSSPSFHYPPQIPVLFIPLFASDSRPLHSSYPHDFTVPVISPSPARFFKTTIVLNAATLDNCPEPK